MDYLIKLCLSVGEWVEDRRGEWKSERETDRKTILTFLSQGAVGGMTGYFLVTLGCATLDATVFSFLYCVLLPVILVFGAAAGAFAGMFVWLAGVFFKRRIGFIGRTVIIAGGLLLLSLAFSYWNSEQTGHEFPTPLLFGFVCAIYLPIVLMTGSGIRPSRVLVFGFGRPIAGRTFRGRLAIPAGFLLRVASIFALLESLLVLSVWISIGMAHPSDFAALDGPAAIIFAVIYFGASTYLSLKTPRKKFLLPLCIALNLPATFLLLTERGIGAFKSDLLVYTFLGFIFLWTLYTFGCLISPAPVSRIVKSVDGTYVIKTYSSVAI